MLRLILCLGLAALPLAPAAAQSTLPADTVVVVTTDGFWIPDPASAAPLLHLPPAQFPGAPAAFVRPAVEWRRADDSFLVSSGAQLFRVVVHALAPASVTIDEITPASAAPLDIWDLDTHPGTGALWVLDQTDDAALRFAPPFAAGMTPELAVPVPATSRALALDSTALPPSLVVTETNQVTRVAFDGSTSVASLFTAGRGADVDPQRAGNQAAYLVSPSKDDVVRAGGSPMLVVDMNQSGFCIPLALSPQDVEWNPLRQRAYVLAGEGINGTVPCQAQFPAFGPNHVVRLPVAQAPPVVVPQLVTFSGGSGITGTQGDLALVLDDFAFTAPAGAACAGGQPASLTLDATSLPEVDAASTSFLVEGAPPSAPVFLVAGPAPGSLPLAGGCALLVTPMLLRVVGITSPEGTLELSFATGGAVSVGQDAWLQAVVPDGGVLQLSQALQVHFGE